MDDVIITNVSKVTQTVERHGDTLPGEDLTLSKREAASLLRDPLVWQPSKKTAAEPTPMHQPPPAPGRSYLLGDEEGITDEAASQPLEED